jgi:hypothetical protein
MMIDEMRSINSEVSLDSERTLEPDEAKEDYLNFGFCNSC